MEIRVNATRMQLLRTRKRLRTAVRGHKLLKDKRDELMKKFLDLIRRARSLREEVEKELSLASRDFVLAQMAMSREAVEEALMSSASQADLKVRMVPAMNVRVPEFSWESPSMTAREAYPYGFTTTVSELDRSASILAGIMPKLVELAQVEKACELLADEIEKPRRRVNALEYVLIPRLSETVRYITMKLDEMERGNATRLMKLKDVVRAKGA